MTKRSLDDSTSQENTGRVDKVSRTSLDPANRPVNRPSKTISQCAAGCGKSVLLTPTEGIPCFTCNIYTHFKCAGIKTTAKTKIEAIRKTFHNKGVSVYFLCVNCVKSKAQLRPSNCPTDEELTKKLKGHEKEINRLTTITYDTESKTEQLREQIKAKRQNPNNPFSEANLNKFNELIQAATAPLLLQIRELRNEIAELKTAKKVTIAKPLKEPPKIAESPKSFAEILSENGADVNAIRNITIEGQPDEIENTLNTLKTDETIHDNLIVSIRDTGNGNYTIKCADGDSANDLMAKIRNRYPRIKIKPVIQKGPRIKVTGIPINFPIVEDLFAAEIQINNPWFTEDARTVRSYIVNGENPYQCAILEVSLELMRLCLEKKRVQLGFNTCRIYEESSLIQCKKCFNLGHMARGCHSEQKCRRCGSTEHSAQDCPNDIKCFNCANEISNGIKLPTNHLVTEDRCYMKQKRLESLKIFLMKQN